MRVILSNNADKDLSKLDKQIQRRIDKAIKEKLATDPEKYLVPLMGAFKSCFINLELAITGLYAEKMVKI